MGNTYGKIFKVTTFGESHGPGIGVVIDGCPAGLPINMAYLQNELDRRRPGQSKIVTQRKEEDKVEILSGIFAGHTTGTPITLFVRNQNQRSDDYAHLEQAYRPSHADYTYDQKYQGFRDYRGGGRSSARETAARVAAGAVAKMLLANAGVYITAFVSQVGHIAVQQPYTALDLSLTEHTAVRCPHLETAAEMENLIKLVRKQGDTIGGIVTGIAQGVPAGWGEPVFDKLHAELGKAMLSINAAKGFEYGSGFKGASFRGSEHNDIFISKDNKIITQTNFSGGIQGGISNGMDIYFNTAFKPVATLMKPQNTVDKAGNIVVIEGKGRHDPCVLPRAVPIVEAMTALVLADFMLRRKANFF